MSHYTKIKDSFWTDEKVQGWGDQAKLLALYLTSSRHKNLIGCYQIPIAYIAEDLGWTEKDVASRIDNLEAAGFIRYDYQHKVVWIIKFLRHNEIENRNQWIAARKLYEDLPKTTLLKALREGLNQYEIRFNAPLPDREEEINNPLETLPEPLRNRNERAADSVAVAVTVSSNSSSNSISQKRVSASVTCSADFEEFWKEYPSHIDKRKSYGCWRARLKEGVLTMHLIEAAQNYAATRIGEDEKYTMHPSTFLGPGHRWEEYIKPRGNGGGGKVPQLNKKAQGWLEMPVEEETAKEMEGATA